MYDLCGVDSLYHAQTNVSVKRDFFEGISIWNIYKGGCCFSLMCTFKKIDVQNGSPKENKWTTHVLVLSKYLFIHSLHRGGVNVFKS